MRAILERERPWIELFHPEAYALYHGWIVNVKPPGMSLPTYKYLDVDPQLRARAARRMEPPVRWPLTRAGRSSWPLRRAGRA